MPSGGQIWDLEWLNANASRAYPLSESATKQDTTESFELPDDFLVDLMLPVHAGSAPDPSKFHVSGVTVFNDGVTVSFAYDGTTFGSVSIAFSGFERNSAYFLNGTGDFYDTVGKIIVGSLDTIRNSSGSFSFNLAGGRLEPAVIRPHIRGVSALYVQNGDDLSEAIQGDVALQPGANFAISIITGVGGAPDRIVLSAISGEGLNEECDCGENRSLPDIKTINAIGPDDAGNFTLEGDDCLTLTPITNGLKMEDECSKPCCGCDELNVVLTAMEQVLTQVNSLENLASRLETAFDAMQTNLLASKTGSTM